MKAIRTLMSLIVFTAVFALAAVGARADERYGSQKVLYHVNTKGGDENGAYRMMLRNIQNHVEAVGKDKINVKVVLHGDGVELLRQAVASQPLQMGITSLKTQNVQFLVCANTLEGRKIDPDKDLFDVADDDIVPSGVAEVSHLQQQGYTYIKP